MKNPSWLEKAIFYEIYPQSFYDSNSDGIGDLKGIIKKLDRIEDTGFNAIWLNPIFESSFFDAGYDIIDYYKVDKRYGTNKDLYDLIFECHKRGIKLILDLVPGHTSIYHPWFKKSCENDHNEYSKRYIWTKDYFSADTKKRWIGGFSKRKGACLVNFYSIQPALNYGFYEIDDPEYQERIQDDGPQKTINAIIDIILFWLGKGIDGFRVDMAGWLVKNDPNQDGTVIVWKQIFEKVRQKYPKAVFVSEWNHPEKSMAAGFDMDFLLQDPFTKTNHLLTRTDNAFFKLHTAGRETKTYMDDFQKQLSFANEKAHYVSLISDNHDNPRLRKYLNEEEMLFYYAFMLSMPNVPFFYYGDEIAMPYIENMESVEGGYERTGSRVPMYWDKFFPNCGFSKAKKTLIPVKGYKSKDVKDYVTQFMDPDSLLSQLKRLIQIHKKYKSLDSNALFTLLENGDDTHPLIYRRRKDDESILVIFNPGGQKVLLNHKIKKVIYSHGSHKILDGSIEIESHSFLIAKE